jgi:hypothetical protein
MELSCDYRTLGVSFGLLFTGSLLSPLLVLILALFAVTLKNHELLLSQSPAAQQYVGEFKELIKPYVRFLLGYIRAAQCGTCSGTETVLTTKVE